MIEIYSLLLAPYGPQGWWPLLDLHEAGGSNPTKTGSIKGYHPGDYSYPKTRLQQFEISIGAILTQSTSWAQVETALFNLRSADALRPDRILALPMDRLSNLIRPAGYHNQKARKLKIFSKYFLESGPSPDRENLLRLWGVGEETADSILLYAYREPIFVVDAYTRRIFSRLGSIGHKDPYARIKILFESLLPAEYCIYQEFHALVVEHAKTHCRGVPLCSGCILNEICQKKILRGTFKAKSGSDIEKKYL